MLEKVVWGVVALRGCLIQLKQESAAADMSCGTQVLTTQLTPNQLALSIQLSRSIWQISSDSTRGISVAQVPFSTVKSGARTFNHLCLILGDCLSNYNFYNWALGCPLVNASTLHQLETNPRSLFGACTKFSSSPTRRHGSPWTLGDCTHALIAASKSKILG